MPGNFIREDLRIIKTRSALFSALSSLLEQYRFSKITVHDICTEALVSRTAFYAHYKDKYDLLQKWLETIRGDFLPALRSGGKDAECGICSALRVHMKLIENLIYDANREQWQLLLDFFALDAGCEKILSDFFAGGILNLLYVQVGEHRALSAEEIPKSVSRVYGIMKMLLERGYENNDQ